MRALTELKKECFRHVGYMQCFCCEEDNLKRLLAHHLTYTSNSITYKKFPNSDIGRCQYYAHLIDEINLDETNFMVLCFNCHKLLEELLKLEPESLPRNTSEIMIKAYNRTRRKRGLSEFFKSYSYEPKTINIDDVFYESFTERVNFILKHPDLDESYKKWKLESNWNETFRDYQLNKTLLKDFTSYIPKEWGYSFHEGDCILHCDGLEFLINDSEWIKGWLISVGCDDTDAMFYSTKISYLLDFYFFRELIPKLSEGQKLL